MIEWGIIGFILGIMSCVHIFPHSKSFWETIYDYITRKLEENDKH